MQIMKIYTWTGDAGRARLVGAPTRSVFAALRPVTA